EGESLILVHRTRPDVHVSAPSVQSMWIPPLIIADVEETAPRQGRISDREARVAIGEPRLRLPHEIFGEDGQYRTYKRWIRPVVDVAVALTGQGRVLVGEVVLETFPGHLNQAGVHDGDAVRALTRLAFGVDAHFDPLDPAHAARAVDRSCLPGLIEGSRQRGVWSSLSVRVVSGGEERTARPSDVGMTARELDRFGAEGELSPGRRSPGRLPACLDLDLCEISADSPLSTVGIAPG